MFKISDYFCLKSLSVDKLREKTLHSYSILIRDVSSPEEVFVALDDTAEILPVDYSDLLNERKYAGNQTILNLKRTERYVSFNQDFKN